MGDELVIAQPDISRRGHAGHVAKKVLASLAQPFFLEEHEILLSASIGISIFPDDGRDAGTLLQNADVAMARAKKRGSSAHRFYSQEMNQRSFEHLKLEGGLRRASERDELYLVYQPQLDLNSGRITGAEALLRWQHPERGLISPAQMQFLRGAGCEEIQGHYFSRPLAAESFAELLLQTNGCAPASA